MHLLSRSLCTLVLLLALRAPARAADEWPQFRGPAGQGQTDHQHLPVTWSESEHVVWKTAVPGLGHSSPVVGRGTAWLTTALEDGRSLRVVAIDVHSGQIKLEREVLRTDSPPPLNAKNSHASPTPALDGDRLFVHYGTSGTACLSTVDGSTLWTNEDLKIDHGEGPGSSPILWNDLLIVHCDGRDAQYIVALDKQSGKIRWKTARSGEPAPVNDMRKAFATPLVIQDGGRELLISPAAQQGFAYDPRSGAELWHIRYAPGFSNVPRPLFGHGLVYICTGYMKPELWAVRPDGAGDVTESHVVWKVTQHVPANSSPVLVGDELYMVSDAGIATCLDARTGKQHWRERLGDSYSASLLAAPGLIYYFSEGGQTTVIRPGTKFHKLAQNVLDAGIMATPAVTDSALLLRTRTHLYRLDDSAPAELSAK